jgi:hypothetical protein
MLVFLVSETNKIVKSSKGFFYHSFLNNLLIVLPRIFGVYSVCLEMMKRGCLYRKWGSRLVWPEL